MFHVKHCPDMVLFCVPWGREPADPDGPCPLGTQTHRRPFDTPLARLLSVRRWLAIPHSSLIPSRPEGPYRGTGAVWVIVIGVFIGNQLFDAAENFLLFLAVGLGIAWIWRETCKFLFFRPILRNCERTPDRLGYIAAREIHAAALSWRILYFQAAVLPLLFAASVAASSWPALPVELRIALPVMIGLAGLNLAHLFVLKRRRVGAKAAAPAP